MLRLAQLSIRRPALALVAWAPVAGALALVGLGVSHSLSPSVTVVPGSESSCAEQLARQSFGPSVLVPILLEGPARRLDRQGPRLVVALSHRPDTWVMSAWSRGATGAAPRPRRDAAMVVAAAARSEREMVATVQLQIDRLVARELAAPVRVHVSGQPTLDRALNVEAIATTRQAALIVVGVLLALLLAGLRARSRRWCWERSGSHHARRLRGDGAAGQADRHRRGRGRARLVDGDGARRRLRVADPRGGRRGRGRGGHDRPRGVFSGTALALALVLATTIVPTKILRSVGIGVLLCSLLATAAALLALALPATRLHTGPSDPAYAGAVDALSAA